MRYFNIAGLVFCLTALGVVVTYGAPRKTPEITNHQFVILEAKCALAVKEEVVTTLLGELDVADQPYNVRKKIAEYIVWHEVHQCMANKVKDNQ